MFDILIVLLIIGGAATYIIWNKQKFHKYLQDFNKKLDPKHNFTMIHGDGESKIISGNINGFVVTFKHLEFEKRMSVYLTVFFPSYLEPGLLINPTVMTKIHSKRKQLFEDMSPKIAPSISSEERGKERYTGNITAVYLNSKARNLIFELKQLVRNYNISHKYLTVTLFEKSFDLNERLEHIVGIAKSLHENWSSFISLKNECINQCREEIDHGIRRKNLEAFITRYNKGREEDLLLLRELIKDGNDEIALLAARGLEDEGGPFFAKYLKKGDKQYFPEIFRYCGLIKYKGLLESAVTYLADIQNVWTKLALAVLYYLQRIGDRSVSESLTRVLIILKPHKILEKSLEYYIIAALGTCGTAEAIDIMYRCKKTENEDTVNIMIERCIQGIKFKYLEEYEKLKQEQEKKQGGLSVFSDTSSHGLSTAD